MMERNKAEENIIAMFEEDYSKAYSMLFTQFYTPMQRVASRYVGTLVADDIVHDIFLNIWKSKFKVDNIFALKSYLYNSVHNKCLNEIRKNKNGDKYASTFSEYEFDEAVMDEDLFSQLLGAIELLPENYKIAIELSLEGESLSDIAKIMNTTIDAVKKYKVRAKLLLKKRVGEIYFLNFL